MKAKQAYPKGQKPERAKAGNSVPNGEGTKQAGNFEAFSFRESMAELCSKSYKQSKEQRGLDSLYLHGEGS